MFCVRKILTAILFKRKLQLIFLLSGQCSQKATFFLKHTKGFNSYSVLVAFEKAPSQGIYFSDSKTLLRLNIAHTWSRQVTPQGNLLSKIPLKDVDHALRFFVMKKSSEVILNAP